jgi:hypothetical protein
MGVELTMYVVLEYSRFINRWEVPIPGVSNPPSLILPLRKTTEFGLNIPSRKNIQQTRLPTGTIPSIAWKQKTSAINPVCQGFSSPQFPHRAPLMRAFVNLKSPAPPAPAYDDDISQSWDFVRRVAIEG